jgi:hypothetical protein
MNRVDLNSSIWGPSGWFFIDSIVLSYPKKPTDEQKQEYKKFFSSFSTILPCEKCREHFGKYLKKYPLSSKILESKDNFIIWILAAHNNIRKNKISLKEFYDYYNEKYKLDVKNSTCKVSCSLTNNNINDEIKLSTVLFAIIIALSLYLFRLQECKK